MFDWPLMDDSVTKEDVASLVEFLTQDPAPRLTQGSKVKEFEERWAAWLGMPVDCVFVNSGSSANLLSMAALVEQAGGTEVIVPPLTWSSDIASLIHMGLEPVFCDIDLSTLALDTEAVLNELNRNTAAVFLTHVLGYDGLTDGLLDALYGAEIPLIEDACESHGTTHNGQKVGTFGLIGNFSFYFAHHLTTVEGGMICTPDSEVWEMLCMLRSHGMVRESPSVQTRQYYEEAWADCHPEFIFALPGFNVRNTELGAVLGLSQLTRLDDNNEKRQRNLGLFLERLDPDKFFVDFRTEGSCNYALTLLLRESDPALMKRVVALLHASDVEFRRGMSGGGNQLRQPYAAAQGFVHPCSFPNTEHVHHFGLYLGNYPSLDPSMIDDLCERLNRL